jgi:hypothetical protein
MAEKLAQDGSINDFCLSTYGSRHSVEIDEDIREPQTSAPAIRLHSPYKRASERRDTIESGFYLYLLVNASTDALNPEINLDEYSASEQLMTLLGHVLSCINSNRPADYHWEYELETDTITNYPYFDAEIFLQFTEPWTIGTSTMDEF